MKPNKRETLIWILALALLLLFLHQSLDLLIEDPLDLRTFHWAARTAIRQDASPYDSGALEAYQVASGRHIYPFFQPPQALLVIAPLAWLSLADAATLVFALSQISLVLLVFLTVTEVMKLGRDPVLFAGVLGYSFFFDPFRRTLYLGQINIIVTLLIVLVWVGMSRRWPAWAVTLPLALASILKVYPTLLLFVVIVWLGWRAIGWFGLWLLAATLASLPLLRVEIWKGWAEVMFRGAAYGTTPEGLVALSHPKNQSINGLCQRLFLPDDFFQPLVHSEFAAGFVPSVLACGIVAVSALAVVRAARRFPRIEAIGYGMSIVLFATFMVAPISWLHHLVLVYPAALYMTGRTFERGPMRPAFVLAVLASVLVAWDMLMPWEFLSKPLTGPLISIRLFSVAALWILAVVRVQLRPRIR